MTALAHDPVPPPAPTAIPLQILQEDQLGLPAAARRFPPSRMGWPVNASTVWRWAREGVQLPDGSRVRLEVLRVSGRWVTSVQAIARFIATQTEARLSPPIGTLIPRSPAARQRSSAAAAAELERRGIY